MSEQYGSYAGPQPAGMLDAARRGVFISRTYQHLLGAILAFTLIEMVLFRTGVAYPMAAAMLSGSWLLVLGGFLLAGWLFTGMANRSESKATQYLALAGYVAAEAVIFVPLLVIAEIQAPGAISSAAVATLVGFAGLTMVAMFSGQDFSFLGAALRFGGIAALALIVCGALFGFALGTFFSVAMVAFAGMAILYDTSRVMRTYPEDRYVAASLALFASVALMFWYILRLFISRR
jgi:FtsH-binding integral membrane protein